jgi:hypothetical protein
VVPRSLTVTSGPTLPRNRAYQPLALCAVADSADPGADGGDPSVTKRPSSIERIQRLERM